MDPFLVNESKPSETYASDKVDGMVAHTLRVLAIEAVQQANSGHPGLPLGAADLVTVLWAKFLKHNPAKPGWADRDRFVLSAGHGSALLYALLVLWGYPLEIKDLEAFRQWGSRTPGHPEYNPDLGIEITTGPLGQGFGSAVGLALAERWLAARFNRPGFPLVDHFTYVLASDGDLMEGISHEAAALAGHLGLGRLIVLYDDNRITIDGPTYLSSSEDTAARFAAYGWHVQHVDGHDYEAITQGIESARLVSDRPSILLCRTHIGYGSPRQDCSKAHGEPLGELDLRRTKESLGWPVDPPFFVPDEVRQRMEALRKVAVSRYTDWLQLYVLYQAQFPDLAREWEGYIHGELPQNWTECLPDFPPGQPMATRAASGKVLEALHPAIPNLIGGSADLTPSNNTRPKAAQYIQRGEYSGRYIHFGVREHAMGAILNGLALHGLRPYGGTFLVFSDYMRPAIRLAALMGLPVIYVFTHDSIGLGEDGPTHQPVEHLTALRAIPNLVVIRPADANETRLAWRVALDRRDGPTALILTRQPVPQIAPRNNRLPQGGYILNDIAEQNKMDLILLATGSEVHLALDAQHILEQRGIIARLVSFPSWDLFDAQPLGIRQQVIPAGIPCLSIEAGVTLAWGRYIGVSGKALGIDRFGASGPYSVLYDRFGLTPENIAFAAMQLVGWLE